VYREAEKKANCAPYQEEGKKAKRSGRRKKKSGQWVAVRRGFRTQRIANASAKGRSSIAGSRKEETMRGKKNRRKR